ncbi:integrase, catalytic region, zinc finger, CCHC-type containing protein [Tanacetum coccineum]
MTTLAEHIIVDGAKNHPSMLKKSMYDTWASRIHLFIYGKKHDDCDVQVKNIILHGLPPDVYALVNHQEAAKDIWDRGETLYEYYWRFSQLINDMHTIGMTMKQVQVNTKFLNALTPEWSKFVTDVKLAKSFYTTNYDQLYAYLSQLPKVSLVNESLKKLKYQLASFEKIVKKRTTSDAITADENTEVQTVFNQMEAAVDQSQSQEKDTVIRKLKDRIKSLSGKDSVENVKKDIDKIETINIKLKHSVAKLLFENDNLRKEREHLKSIYKDQFDSIRKTCVQSKEQCASERERERERERESIENSNLNDQLQEKVFAIAALKNELRKLKGKNVVDTAVSKPSATIAPEINIPKQTDSLKTKDSNKPLLTSTGVKPTTSASGSKPSGNTKKNRISRPPSSNQKNKVEEHPRKVKSSLNKTNSIFEPISNAHVKHSVRNAMFESICAICNKCLFDANHDMCVIDYVNDVNVRSKSKSKRNQMRKVWKPTGKVFIEIGYSWKPTGRTFTIVRNKCPLTRFTSTKVVPTKETTNKSVLTPTQGIIVYSRKTKASRSVGSSSKVKIVESKTSNTKEPKQSWGSTVSDVPSSSFNDCRFENDHIAEIMGYGDYQIGNVTISQVYYMEGLGHNLISVGQFCDSDLEVAFRKHTCFICDLEGVDLLKGSRGSNLYTLSLENLMLSSPICLLSKASKTKSWLWHRRLSHLNFDYITTLAKQGLV